MRSQTVKLLKECNSGIKMGMNAINNTLPVVENEKLKRVLKACKDKHAVLGDKTHRALLSANAETKPPHMVAEAMSNMKIKTTLLMNDSDETVASLMTDGCNMGIKSIYKYLNQNKSATNEAKQIAKELISAEQELRTDLREFL